MPPLFSKDDLKLSEKVITIKTRDITNISVDVGQDLGGLSKITLQIEIIDYDGTIADDLYTATSLSKELATKDIVKKYKESL
tara:strand:- start:152 stop:397 length:246 start_codon:yes stop_codon:yes gene_type:complete